MKAKKGVCGMSQIEGGNRADGGNGGNFANFAVAGRLGARREARALVLKDTGRPRRFRKWGGVTWAARFLSRHSAGPPFLSLGQRDKRDCEWGRRRASPACVAPPVSAPQT